AVLPACPQYFRRYAGDNMRQSARAKPWSWTVAWSGPGVSGIAIVTGIFTLAGLFSAGTGGGGGTGTGISAWTPWPPWHGAVPDVEWPASHGVPSGCTGVVHAPVVGSHVPGAWH